MAIDGAIQNSEQVRQALAVTNRLISQHSSTFYFATSLLPGRERDAIRALYAFCRTTDNLVDQRGASQREMEIWRSQVRLPAAQQSDPVLLAWALTRQAYPVDSRYEDDLIDGVSRDISPHPYATWEELKHYCYQVASTVGLLSMPVIGLIPDVTFEQARPYAVNLGIALQLTNILRDVGEDSRNGRVYLPQQDLVRFGLTPADITAGVYDERFIHLMKYEIDRARGLYQAALPGIALLRKNMRAAVGAAALLYQAILDEIEKRNYQVHRFRAHTSGLRKIALLPKILLTVARLRAPRLA
jgi:phytoene synthase